MFRPAIAVLMATTVLLPAGATAGAAAQSQARPAAFTAGRITNPWFPLKPGTRMVYRGVDGRARTVDVFDVTYRTRTIQGVVCRVVRDRVFTRGVLSERTHDYYAQSRSGAVWYFGEDTATLDRHGQVQSREGSWLAGRHGARPGVYMTAHPRVGQSRAQERLPGHAEDHFRVIRRSAAVTAPVLASRHALVTKEWTPLEPGVVDHKVYVRDLGLVREVAVRGPRETGRLVTLRHVPRR